jgi:hypothetical protein
LAAVVAVFVRWDDRGPGDISTFVERVEVAGQAELRVVVLDPSAAGVDEPGLLKLSDLV